MVGRMMPFALAADPSLTLTDSLMPSNGNGNGYGKESRYVWFKGVVPFAKMMAGAGDLGESGIDL